MPFIAKFMKFSFHKAKNDFDVEWAWHYLVTRIDYAFHAPSPKRKKLYITNNEAIAYHLMPSLNECEKNFNFSSFVSLNEVHVLLDADGWILEWLIRELMIMKSPQLVACFLRPVNKDKWEFTIENDDGEEELLNPKLNFILPL